MLLVVLNIFNDHFVQFVTHATFLVHLVLKLIVRLPVLIVFETFATGNLPLKLIDFLTVLLFILDVALGAPRDFSLLLFVLFLLMLDFLDEKEMLVVPLRPLDFIFVHSLIYSRQSIIVRL